MPAAIRVALPADVPALVAIDLAVSPSPWSASQFLGACEHGGRGGEFALVLEQAAVLRGFIVCQQVLDELHIHNVAVAPPAQRRGYARQLLKAALARATPGHCLLEVRASNAAA
ncbi:MAG: GNAT family N-acetyltransferase, partial [Parahaliea sp.]